MCYQPEVIDDDTLNESSPQPEDKDEEGDTLGLPLSDGPRLEDACSSLKTWEVISVFYLINVC